MKWPAGPKTVRELMQWADHNAETLLVTCPVAQTCRKNFLKVLEQPIEIHDCYSGSGTGSWTLHVQYERLLRHTLRC